MGLYFFFAKIAAVDPGDWESEGDMDVEKTLVRIKGGKVGEGERSKKEGEENKSVDIEWPW